MDGDAGGNPDGLTRSMNQIKSHETPTTYLDELRETTRRKPPSNYLLIMGKGVVYPPYHHIIEVN
eukprot:1705405-Ditylum_brightwellii.AAC.1